MKMWLSIKILDLINIILKTPLVTTYLMVRKQLWRAGVLFIIPDIVLSVDFVLKGRHSWSSYVQCYTNFNKSNNSHETPNLYLNIFVYNYLLLKKKKKEKRVLLQGVYICIQNRKGISTCLMIRLFNLISESFIFWTNLFLPNMVIGLKHNQLFLWTGNYSHYQRSKCTEVLIIKWIRFC